MKRKILGIFVCMLLIATAVPAVESIKNVAINPAVPSHPLTSMGGNWIQLQKLLASDGVALDDFGTSVSLYENTALIGADHVNNDKGSVYVFTRTGTTWTQQAQLNATNGVGGDYFGVSVSLYGNTALIGADSVNFWQGAAYIFIRTGTTWTQQAELSASDGQMGDYFGLYTALYGNTALIEGGGSAYVFTRTGTTWTKQAELNASGGAGWDDVSLSGDTFIIGADNVNNYQGAAYVFTRTGTTWTQQQKLTAGIAGDEFGVSVSLSGDSALIGAVNSNNSKGSAYVFTRTGTTWTQQARLFAADETAYDFFGSFVSIYDDTALIGAYGLNTFKGSVYVFARSGSSWTQQGELTASDGTSYYNFGISVSLYGNTAIIGAIGYDTYKGSAYMFINEQPPTSPIVHGQVNGKVKHSYDYTFNSTDPNNDNVSYYIDWGDNTSSGWLGPYSSGVAITQSHTWTIKGTYIIKAKAKDIYGNESGWGTLSVTMPLSYEPPHFQFFDWLLERFPHAFPILRHLLGY